MRRSKVRLMPAAIPGTHSITIAVDDALVEEIRDFALRNHIEQQTALTVLLTVGLRTDVKEITRIGYRDGHIEEVVKRYK